MGQQQDDERRDPKVGDSVVDSGRWTGEREMTVYRVEGDKVWLKSLDGVVYRIDRDGFDRHWRVVE